MVVKISITGEIYGTNTQPYPGRTVADLSEYFTSYSLAQMEELNSNAEDLPNQKLRQILQNIISINICSEITDKSYWEDVILYRDPNENNEATCDDELMNSGLETVFSNILENIRRLESLFGTVSSEEAINSKDFESLDKYTWKMIKVLDYMIALVRADFIEVVNFYNRLAVYMLIYFILTLVLSISTRIKFYFLKLFWIY